MSGRYLCGALLCLVLSNTLPAVDVQGSIIIKRKLTKRKVTVDATSYDRGIVTPVARDAGEDPLAFERRHVVIYVDESAPAEPASASVEQKNRQFSPDLVVVPAGSTVSFPNLDPIFHNVFSLSKPKNFDLGNYPKGDTRIVTFPKPGIVMVYCRLHTNMSATIVVTPGPWSARSDANGKFNLRGLPPGRHTFVAWHKTAGFFRQTIEVREGRPTVVEFDIPLTDEGEQIARDAVSWR